MKSYAKHNKREKRRSSRIRTSTLFTRLKQALKLKYAPLFAPLTNLKKNKLKELIGFSVY